MRLPRPLDGLAFRLGLLLTVALFPIGLIAILLTEEVAEASDRREEGAILALTAEVAASDESLLRNARTVARALTRALPLLLGEGEGEDCNAVFSAFVEQDGQFVWAIHVGADGIVRCGSDRVHDDLSTLEITRSMALDPQPRIAVMDPVSTPGLSRILVQEPVLGPDGAYLGYVSLALPNDRSFRRVPQLPESRPLTFIAFNSHGRIIAANQPGTAVDGLLPQGYQLSQFVGGPRRTFSGTANTGEARSYAVVPILPGQLYALGSWPQQRLGLTYEAALASSLLFVSVMWLVSLGVAYLGVHRLAIRNIGELRQRMNRFIATRALDRAAAPRGEKPLEFREIDRTWDELAETVVREEAELENIIHTRTVLLKEVHHRVKNNLQLIASIVSMKIRKASSPEARAALKEVQMRVMSIATVHRSLYTTSTVGMVQVDELLKGVVGEIIGAGIPTAGAVEVVQSWDNAVLYPDQAVPLSLLASEAVTNALKYVGRPPDRAPWMRISLCRLEGDQAVLEIANSRGTPLIPPEQIRGTGLGVNLIRAFGQQLGGVVTVLTEDPYSYTVRIEFRAIGFDQTPQEGGLPEQA